MEETEGKIFWSKEGIEDDLNLRDIEDLSTQKVVSVWEISLTDFDPTDLRYVDLFLR